VSKPTPSAKSLQQRTTSIGKTEDDDVEVDETKFGVTEVDDFYIFCSKDNLKPEVPFLDDIANGR
jgi:hypothetical protein